MATSARLHLIKHKDECPVLPSEHCHLSFLKLSRDLSWHIFHIMPSSPFI